MRVIVYVEGPSDKASMGQLLASLISQKAQEGVSITFFANHKGDCKKAVLLKVPRKAVDILRGDPDSVVVAVPDLYPRNKGFEHETPKQLFDGIMKNFEKAMEDRGIDDDGYKERFKTFCFKHDLEALILAAEENLKNHLGVENLNKSWREPVEDQDHNDPPKRVVERIFKENGQKYQGPVDAPLILGDADFRKIAEKCPQCFKPFVEFLESLP